MKKTKKIIGGLTALAVISAMCAPMSVSAETATTDVTMTKVSPYDELYTVTIPETVTVTNSGWNELKAGDVSGIKVEQTVTAPDKQFDPAKKVSISVASANSYKLKDGDNTVSYTLNAEANGEAVDKWEFSAEEVNAGTAKTVGVDVDADEYDAAPDGSYTDTLTFTIAVEDAVYTPRTYNTLSSGDVLKPGDTIDSNTEYNFFSLGRSLTTFCTWTLVRADVTAGAEEWDEPNVTEKDDGAYYVIKGVDRDNGRTFYMVNQNPEGNLEGMIFSVTDTSDGVVLTQSGSSWTMAVHEP